MLNPAKLAFATPSFNNYKQYDRAIATVTVTGTIASGATANYSDTITLNREQSIVSMQFATDVNSVAHTTGNEYLLNPDTLIPHDDGSTPSFPGTSPYTISWASTFTGNQVVVTAEIFNGNAETLTVVTEVLTVNLYSFVTPFAIA